MVHPDLARRLSGQMEAFDRSGRLVGAMNWNDALGPECISPNDNSEGFAAGGNSFVPYENPCTSITSRALNEPPDAGLQRCNLDAVLSEIGVDAGPPCAAGEVRANVCTTCLAGCGRRELKCVKSCDTQEDCTAANAPGTCMASVCQEFCPF